MKVSFLRRSACAFLLPVIATLSPAQDNRQQTPLMGWSSWNTFRIQINEQLIQETADSMVGKGLKDAGYTFVNVDDGFFAGRNAEGNLRNNDAKFPNGMKAVADHIHRLGLKAGIYSDAGGNTCGSIWDADTINGTGVGLYGHEDRDARLYFTTWGYDFIKIDYCGGELLGLDEQTQYTRIREAIRHTGRKDVRMNVCRWMFPGTWVTTLAGSWRISHDIRNNFDEKLGVRDVLEHNLYLSAYASPGHFNDMDMMQVGRGMTADEERSHFGLWSIMCSPLLIGCDLRTIPQQTLDIITNREVIALNQDILGLQAQVVSRSGKRIVLAKQIEKDQGTIRAVALFNGEHTPRTLRIDFKDIQLDGNVQVRDLWEKKDLGVFSSFYELTVPPHGTAMLRLEGERSFDQTIFEGEDAYMNAYNAVLIDKGTYSKARFTPLEGASGGYVLSGLGGINRADNWAEFRRVYSSKGGGYNLVLHYYSANTTALSIIVNGQEYRLTGLQTESDTRPGVAMLKNIRLHKGYNTIRFANTQGDAPVIDRFELQAVPH